MCFGSGLTKLQLCFGNKRPIIQLCFGFFTCFGVFFYRREVDYLSQWLDRRDRKPLIIRGARQVGKSTLVRLCAEKHHRKLIAIDFEKNPEYAELFKSQDPKKILMLLGALFNEDIQVSSTLLFLDEIQKTPEILQTLRYFYESMPELPVIATGSLLDFILKDIHFSMPVGRVEYLYLGPMNFEDFLHALGKTQLLDFVRNYTIDQTIPTPIHQALLTCVKTYFIVGGLPQVIANYAQNSNYHDTDRIKKSLLISYQEDFAKYASIAEQNRMRLIFNKVPRMLGEKFKYSHVDPEQKSTAVKAALEQLHLARLVHLVYHTDANGLPLGAEVHDKNFKTYFLDVGLVVSALDLTILDFKDDEDFTLVNAGKIAEQFVAEELLQLRELYEPPALYYWMREQKSAQAELDFVVSFQGGVIPIEVKAGAHGTLKSLHYFLQQKNLTLGVRFCSAPPSLSSSTVQVNQSPLHFKLLSLPFYLVGQLRRLLEVV